MFDYPLADASLLERVRQCIRKAGVAHFITCGAEGYPRTRGMEDHNGGAAFIFHFFTSASTRKVAEIKANPRVTLGYYDKDSGDYACIFGQAAVLTDDATRAAFWQPAWTRYWPAGPTDPEYVVIRIVAEAVEFFDMGAETLKKGRIPESLRH